MLDVFALIPAFILTVYLFLIIVYIRGWVISPFFEHDEDSAQWQQSMLRPSIVVCCHNEAHHLPVLIDALRNQSCQSFELIWVNDHSMDLTQQVLEDSLMYFNDARIILSPLPGKKKAQRAGILAAQGNFIITTDADCVPSSTWVETMIAFQMQQEADLIVAPVKMHCGINLFAHIQQLEFATLVGSGMGAASAGVAIFCNAANMAFTKQAWADSADDLHEEEISGDDVFLLHSIKRRKGKVAVLKSTQAMVATECQKTLSSFLRQRVRWASKSPKYHDANTIVAGLIVASINAMLPVLFFTSTLQHTAWSVLGSVFLVKLLIDYLFLIIIRSFFQLRFTVLHVLLLSFLYPLYVVGVGISTFFQKKQKW